jgi:hypothetical protein
LTAWVPMVLSYRARHSMSVLSEDATPVVPTRYWKPPGVATGSLSVSRTGLRGWVVTDIPRYPSYKTSTLVCLRLPHKSGACRKCAMKNRRIMMTLHCYTTNSFARKNGDGDAKSLLSLIPFMSPRVFVSVMSL